MTPRDPRTGRLKSLLRPVYINPQLTAKSGVTMGFLRFRRWSWRRHGRELPQDVLLASYREWKAGERGGVPADVRDEIERHIGMARTGSPYPPASNHQGWPF